MRSLLFSIASSKSANLHSLSFSQDNHENSLSLSFENMPVVTLHHQIQRPMPFLKSSGAQTERKLQLPRQIVDAVLLRGKVFVSVLTILECFMEPFL